MQIASESSPTEFDASHIDFDAFLSDLKDLRREIDDSLGEEDLAHLRKIERIGRAATAVGYATAWMGPNPVSMAGLSLGRSMRWILMHHIGHRGYDKVPNVPRKYTSKVFARGARRFIDWADWMIPEAWIFEHNILHHSHTGEERDPDLIERNSEALRQSNLPVPVRYAAMAFLGLTWRSFYYAPNTLRTWRGRHEKNNDEGDARSATGYERELWMRCYLPYAALQFVALPALFLPLGPLAAGSALLNSLGAEALTNIHTFCVVGPNHTGDDLYRFSTRAASKGEGMVRQVLGSTNYAVGGDIVDGMHLFLNYQIEHHLFPDIPMLRYREVQPKVKALCEKYGIPYVQEGVFTRVKKMLQVAVGTKSMRRSNGLVGAARSQRLAAE